MSNISHIPVFDSADPGKEDADLIKRCRGGDQAAWESLVDRYQRLIFAIPRRAGLSEEQATDVFQDVFLTLFEKIDAIEQPERIRSWIVTTTKFKTWALVRSSKGLSYLQLHYHYLSGSTLLLRSGALCYNCFLF